MAIINTDKMGITFLKIFIILLLALIAIIVLINVIP